jgi:hypothetical protein
MILVKHKSIKKRRIVKKKSHKKHKGGDVSALELADIQTKIQTIMNTNDDHRVGIELGDTYEFIRHKIYNFLKDLLVNCSYQQLRELMLFSIESNPTSKDSNNSNRENFAFKLSKQMAIEEIFARYLITFADKTGKQRNDTFGSNTIRTSTAQENQNMTTNNRQTTTSVENLMAGLSIEPIRRRANSI